MDGADRTRSAAARAAAALPDDAAAAIRRRDALLEVVPFAAQQFLFAGSFDAAIDAILERLGTAVGTDRAYMFTNRRRADGTVCHDLTHEWVAPGVAPELGDPEWQDLTWGDDDEWASAMEAGEATLEITSDLTGHDREVLERHGILSCLDVPVLAAGSWRGYLGFDDLRSERVWTAPELAATRAIADAIGAEVARQQAERSLQASETRYRRLVELSHDGVWTVDPDGTFVAVNDQAARMLGRSPSELIGRRIFDFMPAEEARDARAAMVRRAAGATEQFERALLHADGSTVWCDASATPILDEHGVYRGSFAVVSDVTERRRASDRLAYLAYHDELTGLPNRSRFELALRDALEQAEGGRAAVAVICLDLDRFKLVNDDLGHAAGDEALRQVAERLRAAAAMPGALVARHSGDELLVLLPGLDPASAPEAARASGEALKRALAAPFVILGTEFVLSASIGISLHPHDAVGAGELLRHADMAMYTSKRTGAGLIHLYEPGTADSPDRLSLSGRLRRAVEGDELVLHYQPIVELAGEGPRTAVVAVEALVRWRTPDGALVPPAQFLPAVEELGLMTALTDRVIGAASRQAARWRSAGIDVPVTVNLAPAQLREAGLGERILAAVGAAGGDPRLLVIEVTESGAMQEPVRTARLIGTLRGLGVGVAIDDFGTGYSSLDRLLDTHADFLKIDRSIVARMADHEPARTVFRAAVTMAAALGMRAVAEGVETDAQRRVALAEGCRLVQGFRFGRPLPAAELTPRLALLAGAAGAVSPAAGPTP